jgi:hypothetical protein
MAARQREAGELTLNVESERVFRAASRSPQTPSPASRGVSRPIAGRSARASTCSAPTRAPRGPRSSSAAQCSPARSTSASPDHRAVCPPVPRRTRVRGVARGHRRPRQLRPPLELVPPAGARVRSRPRRGSFVGGARSPRVDGSRRILSPVRRRQRAMVPPPRCRRPTRARGRVAHPRGAGGARAGLRASGLGRIPRPLRRARRARPPCAPSPPTHDRRMLLEPPTPSVRRRLLRGRPPCCCADATAIRHGPRRVTPPLRVAAVRRGGTAGALYGRAALSTPHSARWSPLR